MPLILANLAIFAGNCLCSFAFMKPFSRNSGFYLSVGLLRMQTITGVFAADKQSSPESPASKQFDPGWPREVTKVAAKDQWRIALGDKSRLTMLGRHGAFTRLSAVSFLKHESP
jgi:hypothetical protein